MNEHQSERIDRLERLLADLTARLDRMDERDRAARAARVAADPASATVQTPAPLVAPHAHDAPAMPATGPTSIAAGPLTPSTSSPPTTPPLTPPTTAPVAAPVTAAAPITRTPAAHAAPKTPFVPMRATPAHSATASSGTMELAIGMRVTAWIGAAIIFIGAALLVHLGITSGWWGGMSGAARAALIALAGAGLLACGEIVLRRVGRTPSVGLFGAGLAILYLDAWAAHRFFGVYGESGAFLALTLTAALAFAVTLRTRMLAIGVIALVAAYAVPLLVRQSAAAGAGPDVVLAFYLTLVLGGTLALSAFDARAFRVLRIVAIVGMIVPAAHWIVSSSAYPQVAAVATGVWWGLVLAESVIAAVRRQTPALNVTATFLATILFITGGAIVLALSFGAGARWDGLYTLLPAIVAAAVGWQLGGAEALTKWPSNAPQKLATALYWQSAALALAAIALLAPANMMSVTWVVIALAAAECGRRMQSRLLRVFAVAALVLASGRAVLIDSFGAAGAQTIASLPLLNELTLWSLIMFCVVAGWFITALRWPSDLRAPHARPGAAICSWTAAVLGAGALAAHASSVPACAITFCLFGACFLAVRMRTATTGAAPVTLTLFALAAATVILAPERLPLALQQPMHVVGPAFRTAWFFSAALAAAGICAAIVVPAALGRAAVAGASAARAPGEAVAASRSAQPARERVGLGIAIAVLVLLIASVPELASGMSAASAAFRPPICELALRFSIFAALVCAALLFFAARLPSRTLTAAGIIGVLGAAAIFLGPGALGTWLSFFQVRSTPAPLPPLLHLELLAAAVAVTALLLGAARGRALDPARIVCLCAAGLIVLVEGTLELDRIFGHEPATRNAALSLYWGLFGIALVGAGLLRRIAPLRYAGLTLLSIVTAKVLFVDLAALSGVPRILSFFAAGGVLLATSVVYGKLAAAVTGVTGATGQRTTDKKIE